MTSETQSDWLVELSRAAEGFNTPQLAAESVSKACFGVHTRDFRLKCCVNREDKKNNFQEEVLAEFTYYCSVVSSRQN